jgi:hypothetical protein
MSDHPANGNVSREAQASTFHSWRLLIGTLVTPLAWAAQMLIGEVLTAEACSLNPEHSAAPPSWVMTPLIALSCACFVLGLFGVIVAWRNVRDTRAESRRALNGRARRIAELEWFFARVGALCSAMFMFGLIATDLAVVVVSPCGHW